MAESRPSSAHDATRRDPRRIDEIFGDPLPDVTSDERDERPERGKSDQWYLENRPPHHDR